MHTVETGWGRREGHVSADQVVDVLFHGIGTPARELEPGEAEYWVSGEQYLRILDEAMTWPGVRFSFDDCNSSDVELGLPALLERGLTARFNIIADRLGRPGSLSEDDLRELRRQGMQVGNHGMVHRSWRHLDGATARQELWEARVRIQEAWGEPVTVAACPFGDYDRSALRALRSAGYESVCTSDRRPVRPGQWLQPRYSVKSTDTPESLRREVLELPSLQRLRRRAAGLVKSVR